MANASVPAMVDAELEAFSVLARGLTPAQWTTPSLCAAWTVRDIIEHTAFHTHRGLQDVRRSLGIGRDYPDAAMRATLDLCTSAHGNILVLGSRRRPGRGLRLQANDIDWSKGRGAEVVGSAEALLMAIAGRRVALEGLSGPGVATLEESLEILSNPKAMREIRGAEAEIDRGKALTADELRAKYLEK